MLCLRIWSQSQWILCCAGSCDAVASSCRACALLYLEALLGSFQKLLSPTMIMRAKGSKALRDWLLDLGPVYSRWRLLSGRLMKGEC